MRIFVSIPAEGLDVISKSMADIRALLPEVAALRPVDRRRLTKLHRGERKYASDVLNFTREHPELQVSFLPIEEMSSTQQFYDQMVNLTGNLQNLLRYAEDLMMLSGERVSQHARAQFKNIRTAAENKVPPAVSAYNQLKTFNRRRSGIPAGASPVADAVIGSA